MRLAAILPILLLATAATANLIPNGSFESGEDRWHGWQWSVTWSLADWTAHTGQYSAWCDPVADQTNYLWNDELLPPGVYRVSVWAKSYPTNGGEMTLRVGWHSTSSQAAFALLPTQTDWRQFTALLAAADPQVLYLGVSGSGDDLVIVDDVEVVPVPEPSDLVALSGMVAAWVLAALVVVGLDRRKNSG